MTTSVEERLAAYRPSLEAAMDERRDPEPRHDRRSRGVLGIVGALAAGAIAAGLAALWMLDGEVATHPTRPADEPAVPASTVVTGTVAAPTTIVSSPPTGMTPSTAAVPKPVAIDAVPPLAIGDGVMLGAVDELTAAGIDANAVVSRQMHTTVSEVEWMRDFGQLSSSVVVHLGTGGPVNAETADRFFTALGNVRQVVVLTAHADRSWIAPTNDVLRALPDRFPNVRILDWDVLAAQCPGDCFYDDGIHINQQGQLYYAALIVDALGLSSGAG